MRVRCARIAALGALAIAACAGPAAAAAEHPGAAGHPPPTHERLKRATSRFLEPDRPAPPPARSGPAPVSPLLPANRVLALYGAPQLGQTILGLRTPRGAARKLSRQSAPYAALGSRPVVGAFDLIAVFATASAGADGLYRSRQDDRVIATYLEQARAVGARLILDIQPGRSTFLGELRELREWVVQPDVDLALDPEWNVGPGGVPGRTSGSVSARKVNAIARQLARTVRELNLPPKLLVVHQFRTDSIRARRRIAAPPEVQPLLNFDGFGAPAPKRAGYAALSVPDLFDGFSLFYRRDTPLMGAGQVLGLEPEPDFLLYQ